eukprot:gnl/MRDRNA2_/MRDRNA2_97324_c0_seq1.p1 gnl/MRDRNA2_/MRDRNA2_97324_c0~~gnl/MRDRNA2_/MRDRNA2_97324_c0_seq1.p1  ORF type:complete len:470 (+),score=62.76 gnl/MRDRNA2_/MRDRNA2_97324_c0_seq1:85-1494(+)
MTKANSACHMASCHFFVVWTLLVVPASATSDPYVNQKKIGQDSPCGHCDGPCFQNRCLFEGPEEPDSRVLDPSHNGSLELKSAQPDPRTSFKGEYKAHLDSDPHLPRQDEHPARDVAFLSTDASSLRKKLLADEKQMQSLQSENMRLRFEKTQVQEEFRTWATALGRITSREARMAEIIGAAKIDPTQSKTWEDAGSQVATHGSSFASWIFSIPTALKSIVDSLQGVIFLIVLTIGLFVLYRYRSRVLMLLFETEEVKLSWQDILWECLSCCGVCWPLTPLGRALGLTYMSVEISEIQLGHLPCKGDVFVTIDIGTNQLMHTRTINRSDGVFLRFRERFKVNVRKTDGDCVFKVTDQDILVHDEIARLEISAWEFCKLAKQGNKSGGSGFYRFDLQHGGQKRTKHIKGHHDSVRPYIAFRLRDVTENTFTGMTEQGDATKSRVFLESLKSQPGQTHFTLDPSTNELDLP